MPTLPHPSPPVIGTFQIKYTHAEVTPYRKLPETKCCVAIPLHFPDLRRRHLYFCFHYLDIYIFPLSLPIGFPQLLFLLLSSPTHALIAFITSGRRLMNVTFSNAILPSKRVFIYSMKIFVFFKHF